MNFLVHLIVTLITATILKLNLFNFWLALGFGLLVDLDHVVPYIKTYLKEKKIDQRGYPKRWYTQEPIFFVILIPLSVILGTAVPVLFYGLHLLLDYIMDYEKYPLFPNKKLKVYGFVKTFGWAYWLITLFSLVAAIIFFSSYENMTYLLSILR
ncbi:MAG: hypothetical protein ABIG95_06330 [Candidatus Woesearchaeota archaeon]